MCTVHACCLCQFPIAAVTDYPSLSGQNNVHLWSNSSGGQKSEMVPLGYTQDVGKAVFPFVGSRSGFTSVLVHSGCYIKNTIDWVASKQQKFNAHSSGAQKSKIRLPSWPGECPLPGHRRVIVSARDGRGKQALWDLFYKDLMPFRRAPPSWPKQTPKALSPNTITVGVRFST